MTNAIASDTLVEAIARAMWDAGEQSLPERIRMKWDKDTDGAKSRTWLMAQAALTAITEAGHVVMDNEELASLYVSASGKAFHASDCATSSAPAHTPGPCDCDFQAAQGDGA